ncbi:MAG: hypothetical protein AB7V18_19295 [Pyrinomonadaceae bacterium]
MNKNEIQVSIIALLVKRLGGKVRIDKLELLHPDYSTEIHTYEDIARQELVIEVREKFYGPSLADTLRSQASPQRPTHGGDCVATPLQPEQHDGDYAYYEIVEGDLPQLSQSVDQQEAPPRDQQGDQSPT